MLAPVARGEDEFAPRRFGKSDSDRMKDGVESEVERGWSLHRAGDEARWIAPVGMERRGAMPFYIGFG